MRAVVTAVPPLPPLAIRTPRIRITGPPMMGAQRSRNFFALLLFAISFLPYGLPEEERPPIYQVPPLEERLEKQRVAFLNRYLGGDIEMLPWED